MKVFGIICMVVGGLGLILGETLIASAVGFSVAAEIKCGLILGFGVVIFGLGCINDNLIAARALISPPASTQPL
jgi:hypothetical protein